MAKKNIYDGGTNMAGNFGEAPVAIGEHIKLQLLGTGSKGDFYGRHKGFVVFVRDVNTTTPQDTIMVEITEVKERCAFAKKV
jgi:predicted RNA-binding protein with TRAM domain